MIDTPRGGETGWKSRAGKQRHRWRRDSDDSAATVASTSSIDASVNPASRWSCRDVSLGGKTIGSFGVSVSAHHSDCRLGACCASRPRDALSSGVTPRAPLM